MDPRFGDDPASMEPDRLRMAAVARAAAGELGSDVFRADPFGANRTWQDGRNLGTPMSDMGGGNLDDLPSGSSM